LHLNTTGVQEEEQSMVAQGWNNDAANLEVMAGILHTLPIFNIHMTPMSYGVEFAWGTFLYVSETKADLVMIRNAQPGSWVFCLSTTNANQC
jgi:hypothetical protein